MNVDRRFIAGRCHADLSAAAPNSCFRCTWASTRGAVSAGLIERLITYRPFAFMYIWLAVGRGLAFLVLPMFVSVASR
eukprot:15435560-Alexandrium_andersonii.AAC.1